MRVRVIKATRISEYPSPILLYAETLFMTMGQVQWRI